MRYLKSIGFPEENLHTVFGYSLKEDQYMGKTIPADHIVHMGCAFKWLPRAAHFIANGSFSAVCYMEDDIRMCEPLSVTVDFVARSWHSIIWSGYDQKPYLSSRRGCYQLGTKMLWFKKEGLGRLLDILVLQRPKRPGSPIFRHLDNVIWDELKFEMEVAPRSAATQLAGFSSVDGRERVTRGSVVRARKLAAKVQRRIAKKDAP